MAELPKSVREIAEVIGEENALALVKAWRKHYTGTPGKKAHRAYIYVPKRVMIDHPLVQILGFELAAKMVDTFGGEGLMVATCSGNKGGRPKKNPVVEMQDGESQNTPAIHNGVFNMPTSLHGVACA